LSVCHDPTVRGVNAREVSVLGVAGFEDVIPSAVGSIVSTTNAVEDVLAVASSIGFRRITSLQAESVAAHEVGPLNDLNERTVPNVREHDTTHRVATEISTVRVHFTSVVTGEHVNLGLVDETNDLDVIGSSQILHTSNGSSRNETCTMTGP